MTPKRKRIVNAYFDAVLRRDVDAIDRNLEAEREDAWKR